MSATILVATGRVSGPWREFREAGPGGSGALVWIREDCA